MKLAPIILAAALLLAPVARAQLYLPQGVGLPAQSVIGNTKNVPGDAVAVPFAQLKAALGVPAGPQSCAGSSWVNSLSLLGIFSCAQPGISDVSGLTSALAALLPGGSSGQIQSNNGSGGFSGFTVSGDGALNTSTGALTISKIGGVSPTFATAAAATKANQQSGSSSTVVVTPSQQQSHPSAAKAWAAITGSSGALQQGYNINTVTRNSAGDYTITFTTSFAASTYACVVGSENTSTLTTGSIGRVANGSRTTSQVEIQFFNASSSATATDPTTATLICFGGQ